MATFLSSGDFGDILYALPSVRALGGGEFYFADRPWTRTRWSTRVLSAIKPLIDSCGYATAHLHDGEWIDHDLSTFRHGGYKLGDTIMERQRRWVGAEHWDGKPWLFNVESNKVSPIVINRAPRWKGFHFPWREILNVFYDDIVFIGLPQEHAAFQKEFGKVFFCPCEDLLEAAQIIAGAELFIGSQSAPLAIANALGKALVVEVCPYGPDCFIRKKNSFFSLNGEVEIEVGGKKLLLPSYSGRFETEVGGRKLCSDDADKLRVIARSVHAFNGTFAFYDEVPVH